MPAQFTLSFTAPPTTNTAAQITGFLHLNSAYPAISDDRILVDATTPAEAVRKGLFGRVGVRFNTFAGFYDYGMNTTSETAADHKPFLIEMIGDELGGLANVRLEDLSGCGPNQPEQPDWDYNDQVWSVAVLDVREHSRIEQPKLETMLEVLDTNSAGMTDLKVGKWENAFNANGANAVTLKANFIDLDPDRYKLRLTDPRGTDAGGVRFTQNNTVDTVKVGLSSLNDAGNQVTLTETGVNTGVFESKNLLLMSNQTDDAHNVDDKPDNTLDDRTLEVKLGDMVSMSYSREGLSILKKAPVRWIKTVNVHVTVMTNKKVGDPGAANNAADGFATQAQVNEWMEKANAQYAQIGVRLDWTTQFADQPAGVDLSDEGLSEYNGGPATITQEEKDLIRGNFANGNALRTASTKDVELFIVNKLSRGSLGESFPEEWLRGHEGVNDLVDTSIVAWDEIEEFLIAHEIGHVLMNWGNPSHYDDRFPAAGADERVPNLMRGVTSNADAVTASKRLRQHQQTDAYGNRPNLIEDYIP